MTKRRALAAALLGPLLAASAPGGGIPWGAAMADQMTTSGGSGRSSGGRNHLAGATSPYLLQHAGNPVDWYPWGPVALDRARRENKPIFLSIGYSACHWCHVMEHESFEDPATAALLNEQFVSIKVDREERPDLDDIYMTAVQMMTGSGGWPLSVWLTPDLEPFYGGTYFPKQGLHGRPSFTQVLTALGESWRKDPGSLIAQAGRVHEAVAQYLSGRRTPAGGGPLSADLLARAIDDMTGNFDHSDGGFGSAPKFPPHRALVLLLAAYRQRRDENLLRMATLTFDRMAYGGLYDQIGGGFHRYATDARWLVPHFEKMLYDNALLADAYLDAWQTTGRDLYRRIPREILDWTLREMTDPAGGFYSTLDADSEGEEGRYYVWRPDQVRAILGDADAALVNEYYGITPRGNFEGGASIPNVAIAPESFAERRGLAVGTLLRRVEAARRRLLEARGARVRPHLDDKVLTAWNGLMIAALARCGRAFDEPRYLAAAAKAADFLLKNLRGPDGLMRVSWRAGRLNAEGFLDDQAFFIHGLLALHAATGDPRWLQEAVALVKAADGAFLDRADGTWFFAPAGRADLLVRSKSPTDGAIPSGASVMASSLLALARATGDPAWRARAGEILAAYRGGMEAMPAAFHNMIAALNDYLATGPASRATGPVVEIKAEPERPDAPAGGRIAVTLHLDVKEGWHINSAKPSLSWLIPTAVALDPGGPFALDRADYPDGVLRRFGFAQAPIPVYEGTLGIRLTVGVDAAAAPGPARITGAITCQACSEEACLAPEQRRFAIDLVVRPAAPSL